MVALNHNPAQSREAKLDEVREHLNAQVENLVTGQVHGRHAAAPELGFEPVPIRKDRPDHLRA